MAIVSSRRVRRRHAAQGRQSHRVEWSAVILFGLILTAASLAFGAVDRIVQIGLVVLFAVGLLVRPPAWVSLGRWPRIVALTIILVLVGKEFAPETWFGSTPWRTAIESSYAIQLPWTHHPEPGRAVDALLATGVGLLWFLWVRTLAAQKETQTRLAWVMFGAAGVVAIVSYATKGIDANAIYGLRFTPGWQGFGPFPNRNHTASFLAIGALLGCGCVTWAGVRLNWGAMCFGATLLAATLAALLETKSRGGLLAFGVGLLVYGIFVLSKLRSRRATGVVFAGVLIIGTLGLTFGGPALERFSSSGAEVSNASRILIWKDALTLWRDAPLMGHGAGLFASIFPLRQTLPLDNQVVLHPESSWVQWLVELGAMPVGLALILGVLLIWPRLRALFERQSSFYLLAGAFAAVLALLAHALIDVPAHRWGTMSLALAALALVCPAARGGESSRGMRKVALVPLVVAAFWAWPFLHDAPVWSPSTLARALDRAQSGVMRTTDLPALIHYFPLNSKLHLLMGAHQLQTGGRFGAEWEKHFQVALRLSPGSWATPMNIAKACRDLAPGHTLHYWQIALERAGWRRNELFGNALSETSALPGAASTWASYVEVHPELLLTYARLQSPSEAQEYFMRWWDERGAASDLQKAEIEAFYQLAAQWASPEQLERWMQLHPERKSSDLNCWASLFHLRGNDTRAWELLKSGTPEPPYPGTVSKMPLVEMEAVWRLSPENLVNAQGLAQTRALAGDTDGEREIILEIAKREKAPLWFRQKAAYLLAQTGRDSEAVAMLLGQSQ